ncbi:hypothetical protein IAQ61_008869 [Plenodomus lingam]|uniref:uncharacterized protein n=1 Tax=Leptosphaeria maculans TaxID=5022 RepID=UPI00333379C3|nr:hypothetical protein IAQ61_008869 [Plenodomus lingam]
MGPLPFSYGNLITRYSQKLQAMARFSGAPEEGSAELLRTTRGRAYRCISITMSADYQDITLAQSLSMPGII